MKQDWQIEKLGDVCSFLNRGVSPKYLEQGGVCVINQKCVRDHRISYEQSRRHDPGAKTVSADRFIQLGDVLVNSTGTGTLGRVAQIREEPPEPTTVDSHVTIVRPKPNMFFPEFFGYMLVLIEEKIKDSGEGCGGQTELARSVLAEKFKVSYPTSLPEQQRIVAILDQAFEGIATATANAERNLNNARELFDSNMHSIFTHRGEGWVQRTLEEICIIGDGNHSSNYPTKNELVDIGIPFIRATNMIDGKISGKDMRFLSLEKHAQLKKGHLKTGDVLITNRGEIGKTAIVDSTYDNSNLNSQIAWLRTKEGLNNKFLFHILNSGDIQKHFQSTKSGTALQQFTIKQLKALEIPIPPIQLQQSIVTKLNELSAETKKLEAIYQQKLHLLAELKKSILHQAFNGQLH